MLVGETKSAWLSSIATMPMTRKLSRAGVAAAICVAAPASANLLVNGSFEDSSFNGPGGYVLGLTGNDVPGWYIPSSDGTYPWGLTNTNTFGGGPADTGNQWLVLGEANTAESFTIQQTVAGLTPGQLYTLSWAAASEGGCCSPGLLTFLSGSSATPYAFNAPNSGLWWTAWGHYSLTFLVNDPTLTFQFMNDGPTQDNGLDLGLDSVSLNAANGAVPEPASWALMLLGFGAVGFGLRRTRKAEEITQLA